MKENQGKIEDFLAELELKHLQGSHGSSQLNPGFSSRLDEFAKSIFDDATLTKNFTTELRYGMGSAGGPRCRGERLNHSTSTEALRAVSGGLAQLRRCAP